MVTFVCSCLNIRVHGKGKQCTSEDARNLDLPISVTNDVFFSNKVYDVALDFTGITMSQELLCKSRCVDNWIITTCSCCMIEFFAKCNDVHDRAYVSIEAETIPEIISSLMNSENYSPLFKLILPEINDNFIQNNCGIEFQNGNIHQSIEFTQNQVSNYLKDQQKAMEDRIRLFTQNEHSIYANVLQKVRKNKQAMIYLLSNCEENEKTNEPDKKFETSLITSAFNRDSATESSTSTDSAFDKSDSSELPQEENIKRQNTKVLKKALLNPCRSKTKVKKELTHPASIDVGGIFDMEEFEMGDPISSYSDEYSDESENDIPSDVQTENHSQLFGTSVPLSIPGFSKVPRYSYVDDEKEIPKNPQDIAASMRALACSVKDGTEMFGELPRRRLNTGDLLANRPV